jgi:hypothetical protein
MKKTEHKNKRPEKKKKHRTCTIENAEMAKGALHGMLKRKPLGVISYLFVLHICSSAHLTQSMFYAAAWSIV